MSDKWKDGMGKKGLDAQDTAKHCNLPHTTVALERAVFHHSVNRYTEKLVVYAEKWIDDFQAKCT